MDLLKTCMKLECCQSVEQRFIANIKGEKNAHFLGNVAFFCVGMNITKLHAEKIQPGYGYDELAQKNSHYLHSNTFIIATGNFQIKPHFDTVLITTQFDCISFAFHGKVFTVNATNAHFSLFRSIFQRLKCLIYEPLLRAFQERHVSVAFALVFFFISPSSDGVTSCHSISSLK